MDGWIIKQAEEHFHNRKLYTTLAIYEAIKSDVTQCAQMDRGLFVEIKLSHIYTKYKSESLRHTPQTTNRQQTKTTRSNNKKKTAS